MTLTVRDALTVGLGHAAGLPLAHLGIDPDTPDEWRTPDHCLTWLRERGLLRHVDVFTDGSTSVGIKGKYDVHGDTIHAALIAACRAVAEQEAS